MLFPAEHHTVQHTLLLVTPRVSRRAEKKKTRGIDPLVLLCGNFATPWKMRNACLNQKINCTYSSVAFINLCKLPVRRIPSEHSDIRFCFQYDFLCPVGQVKALVSVIKHGNIGSSNRLRKKYSTHTHHSKYQMCYHLSYLIQKLLILFLFCYIILQKEGGLQENKCRAFIKFGHHKGAFGIHPVQSRKHKAKSITFYFYKQVL